MRGVAALAVVQLHTVHQATWFPHGYLAVDFFFLLSGFVISFAYGERLQHGWSTRSFLKTRLIRLYPLYLLGLVLGLGARILVLHFHQATFTLIQLIAAFGIGLFMLPLAGHAKYAYPLNYPTWSLFGEFLANIVHAAFLRRLSDRGLLLWLIPSGLLAVLLSLHRGSLDFGAASPDLLLLVPRVLFSYVAGILLERWWRRHGHSQTWNPLLAFALLSVVFVAPLRWSPWIDLVAVFVLFPALLLLGARSSAGRLLSTPFRLAGLASYAIYILQLPLFTFFHLLTPAGRANLFGFTTRALALTFTAALTAISLLVDRYYDLPVRDRLRTRSDDPARQTTTVIPPQLSAR